jgi:hypothetical protein
MVMSFVDVYHQSCLVLLTVRHKNTTQNKYLPPMTETSNLPKCETEVANQRALAQEFNLEPFLFPDETTVDTIGKGKEVDDVCAQRFVWRTIFHETNFCACVCPKVCLVDYISRDKPLCLSVCSTFVHCVESRTAFRPTGRPTCVPFGFGCSFFGSAKSSCTKKLPISRRP